MACSYPPPRAHDIAQFMPRNVWAADPLTPLYISAPLNRMRRMYARQYYPPTRMYALAAAQYGYLQSPHTDIYAPYIPRFYSDAHNPHSAA